MGLFSDDPEWTRTHLDLGERTIAIDRQPGVQRVVVALGRDVSGTVMEVGAGVRELKAGDFYKKAFAAEPAHINPPDEQGRSKTRDRAGHDGVFPARERQRRRRHSGRLAFRRRFVCVS